MLNRRVLTLNEEEVIEEAERAAYSLYERVGVCIQPDLRWPIE